jgi:hypothetical protein
MLPAHSQLDGNSRGVSVRVALTPEHLVEKKSVKDRFHLDVHVGADAAAAEIERLKSLGAPFAWTSDDRGGLCTTPSDPRATSSTCTDLASEAGSSAAWL